MAAKLLYFVSRQFVVTVGVTLDTSLQKVSTFPHLLIVLGTLFILKHYRQDSMRRLRDTGQKETAEVNIVAKFDWEKARILNYSFLFPGWGRKARKARWSTIVRRYEPLVYVHTAPKYPSDSLVVL